MLTELRSAARSLVRNPGLFLLATATLAIGMGAATSIFSAVDAVVLRPLPYRDQDRLVVMWQTDRRTGAPLVEVSYPEFEAWRDRSKSFDGVAAMTSTNFRVNLTGHGEPFQVEGAAVSADFFDVLGARAALGRMFRTEEDAAGAAPVAILSHSLWQRQFAGDPGVVGRTIIVDGGPATIVGVAGSDVSVPKGADLWFPAGPNIGVGDARQYRILEVVARLRQGVAVTGAEADMAVVSRHLEEERPEKNAGLDARIVPLTTFLYGDTRRALSMLLAGVGLLLLIACANVAHLLLARAADREKEMALHAALGASRGRLLQRLLLESLCLAVAGAVAGLALAHWATRGLALGIPANVPGASHVALDLRAVAFAALLVLATALLFGIAPAFRGARAAPADVLRDASGRSSDGPRGRRFRSALIVLEVALSLVLLAGAGLLGRSLWSLLRLDPGFEPRGVVTARLSLPDSYSTLAMRTSFFEPLLERMKAIRGVDSASMVLLRPLADPIGWDYGFTVEGQTAVDQARNPPSNYEAVSEDYFETMRIPLLRGRTLLPSDGPDAPRVVVVSRGIAERFFPGLDPLGRRIKFGRPGADAPWHTIVGVVGDVRYRGWTSVWADAYVSYRQWSFGRMDLMLRTSGNPMAVVPALREAVYAGDKDLPLASVTTMAQAVDDALAGPRFTAVLMSLLAAAALLLAAVGIHGITRIVVARRRREIGIRMALGASAGDVARLMLGQLGALTAVGVALGLALSVAGSRALAGLLYGVEPHDPATLAAVAAVLAAVALGTGALTAIRAARTDPSLALRHD